jgi:hypothetical protein
MYTNSMPIEFRMVRRVRRSPAGGLLSLGQACPDVMPAHIFTSVIRIKNKVKVEMIRLFVFIEFSFRQTAMR